MANASRPNILLILTDQQRADTIAALGNPVIRTPSLDRLVREGTAFASAYCPSPVCVSSRASLYFGQYPVTTGCFDNGFPMPQDGRLSFMVALTDAGYRTHAVGKLHFAPDRGALRGLQSRDKQEEMVASREEDDYLMFLQREGFGHITDPHGVRSEMYYIPQPAQMPARLHPTQWVGDRSVDFLRCNGRSGGDTPWLLISSFIHPHPPFAPPVPWHKLYRAPAMPLPFMPAGGDRLLTHHNRNQNRYKYRDRGLDLNLIRCIRAYYFACISFIDLQVGRLLAELEESGQLDNTLILFTSDHGELLGDYGCFGKRSMLDASARVPLLARWPARFAAGLVADVPVSLVDVMPTMLSAASAAPPPLLDGVDLAGLIDGRLTRDQVFVQFQRGDRGLYGTVGRRWKYSYSAADDAEYLVDRINDPNESVNRADDPAAAAALESMREATIRGMASPGESSAVDGQGWRRYPRRQMPTDPDAGLIVQDQAWADQRIQGYSS